MKTYFNVSRYQPTTVERLFLKLKDLEIDFNLFFDMQYNNYIVQIKNEFRVFKERFKALQYLDSVVYDEVRKRSKEVMKDFYIRDRSKLYENNY